MGLPFNDYGVQGFGGLGRLLGSNRTLGLKRSIFISYHHKGDQQFYENFSKVFHEIYQVVRDNSLDRVIDSDNMDYVYRQIRENYIAGTSCTLVLCGEKTPWRKFVDWEIKGTLDKEHGLIGIDLPTNPLVNGKKVVPNRLHDNIIIGYALWVSWEAFMKDPQKSRYFIEDAISKSKRLINNSRQMKQMNA